PAGAYRVLAVAKGGMTVERTGDRELMLTFVQPFPHDVMSTLYRSSRYRFSPGELFPLPGMTVRIVATDAKGCATKVAYEFDVPPGAPQLGRIAVAPALTRLL